MTRASLVCHYYTLNDTRVILDAPKNAEVLKALSRARLNR